MTLVSLFKRFIRWLIFLQLFVWVLEQNQQISFYIQHLLANAAGMVINFFSMPIIVSENQLIHPISGNFVIIDNACTGLSLFATIAALILSLNINSTKKFTKIILVIIALQLENLIRISHLYYLIEHDSTRHNFNLYHLYYWQFINFFYALGLIYFIVPTLFNYKKNVNHV